MSMIPVYSSYNLCRHSNRALDMIVTGKNSPAIEEYIKVKTKLMQYELEGGIILCKIVLTLFTCWVIYSVYKRFKTGRWWWE